MPGEGYHTPQGAGTNKYRKMVKQWLDWGQSKELGEKRIMCHSVHHKSYNKSLMTEYKSPQSEDSV